jgi:hypothetical protein
VTLPGRIGLVGLVSRVSPRGRPDRLARSRGRRAGFTLVELTVALVAGLIVALGIVGLSREATRTFHEEVRSSAAEATLRTAIDRLRADLQRAGYMSAANIMATDPHIAHAFNQNNVFTIGAAMNGIRRLAGIHLLPSGSLAATLALSQLQVPALSPDAIEIGGNMTSSEQFEVQTLGPSPASANCTRLTLSANSPALFRVMAIGAPASQSAELNNMFQPDGAGQFIVRLVDDTGRAQFLATCVGTPTAGIATGTGWVDVATDTATTPVLTPTATNTLGGVTATPGGAAYVNPVQIVRWEIVNSAAEPAQYQNALDSVSLQAGVQDPNKFDLVRSFVNAGGTRIDATMEVVAEYAVDLNFAFSVENGTATAPAILTFSFDDSVNNQVWAGDVSTNLLPTNRPQRIRVVRARVVTRTAQADRTVNVGLTNIASTGGASQAFLYRYCLLDPCTTQDDTLRWARTRTITTEVSLPNQTGDFF